LISGYAALNYKRKDALKMVLCVSSLFNFLYAILPVIKLSTNAISLISFYDRLIHSVIMMILVMGRLVLSFGCGIINVIMIAM
jgi:hypothetical protein